MVMMKKLLLVMLLLAVVQAEVTFPFETSLSSETETFLPLNTPVPSSPSPPEAAEAFHQDSNVNPDKTCRTKCGTKCFKAKIPTIRNLCAKVCTQRCTLSNLESLSNCTTSCAQSMPAVFRSDTEIAEGYVNQCYQKCKENR